jgi:hypothetical protein
MLRSTILAAAPDAGMGKTGLFTYNVGTESQSDNICSEPKNGPWSKAVYVKNVKALVQIVGSAGFKVTQLGILVHGDVGGRLWVGDDELNPVTIENYKTDFEKLANNLTGDATVLVYGCVSGLGKDGSVLLKEFSQMLPGRKIVGFNVVNAVKPTSLRRQGGFLPGTGSPCYDTEVWETDSRSGLTANLGQKVYVNAATEDSPHAKVAQAGKIIRWPSDESPKKDDATLKDVLKNWKSTKK